MHGRKTKQVNTVKTEEENVYDIILKAQVKKPSMRPKTAAVQRLFESEQGNDKKNNAKVKELENIRRQKEEAKIQDKIHKANVI